MNISKFYKNLGPGLLYAGAAVGVSHLVQSTRAGAAYGFELVWVLIIANVIKYPFFEFAPRYASSTGKSLVDAYKKIGNWALVLYAILTFATMFVITAAISIVTAGLLGTLLGLNMDIYMLTMIILGLTSLILVMGKFSALESIIKFIIIALAISTIIAVSLSFKPVLAGTNHFDWANALDIAFLIAFVGWMPAPIDVSIWHSTWTVAKQKNEKEKVLLSTSLRDFNIGYIGTAFLALGFLALGAFVMYGSGEGFSSKAVAFSGQLIDMYTSSLGQWAYWIIGVAALTTMFSTSITVLDAYPRVMQPTLEMLFPALKPQKINSQKPYIFWLTLTVIGTIVLILFFAKSMKFMVDLATTVSFVVAPILAILNYLSVTGKDFKDKPKKWLIVYAWIGMIFMSVFSVYYLFWKFL